MSDEMINIIVGVCPNLPAQSLKEIYKGNEISLFSTKVGKPFYKKLGFEIVEDSLMRLKR